MLLPVFPQDLRVPFAPHPALGKLVALAKMITQPGDGRFCRLPGWGGTVGEMVPVMGLDGA